MAVRHTAESPERAEVETGNGESATAIGTSGIPAIPTDEEWQERGERLLALLDEWLAEDPAYDLATAAELLEGLKRHPVVFRSVPIDG
jgi:hypothetical protein